MTRFEKLILITIVLLAAFLRLYKLGELPALNADEASIGYNAYSLIKTGHDEHGNSWPLQFQSFNDYKPGLIFYLVMPMVYVFGLDVFAIRIIPAMLGVSTVLVVYFLAKEIVKDNTNLKTKLYFPVFSALLLAISPWHIHFSRGAWEVNVSTFFITLGIFFFLKINERKVFLYISGILFVLSLYTYHSARIVAPLILIALITLYYKDLFKRWKHVAGAIIVSALLCIPLLLSLKGQAGLARADGVAIWSDIGPQNRVNELRGNYSNPDGIVPKLLHNKPVAYSLLFLYNWSRHFNGEFLFLSGDDIQRNKVPETGQMHLVEFLFIVVGLAALTKKINKRWSAIFMWLLIAPVPAALTFQSPHALRAESMIIPLTLVSAYGVSSLIGLFKKRNISFVFGVIIFLFVGLSALRYLHMYYVHMSKEYPFSSQYGVKELVQYISASKNQYSNIVITDRYDQPYILFLFYMKYDPAKFQKEHVLTDKDNFGFSTVRSFANFKFESISFTDTIAKYPGSLIAGTSEEIPEESNIVKDIYGSNNYKYFRIVVN